MALFRFSHSVGLLDRTEADALRRTAQENGQRPIDVLLQRVDGTRLAEQLKEHLGLPLVDLHAETIQPAALRLLSKEAWLGFLNGALVGVVAGVAMYVLAITQKSAAPMTLIAAT